MTSLHEKESSPSIKLSIDQVEGQDGPRKILWYRSSYFNAVILGLCNSMNSLGAGGAQSPYLVNTANALIFSLMVLSATLSSSLVNVVGIRITLILGTLGFAPYAAGLYTNNRYGTEWFVLFGAALCGLAAGTFWMAEAAIALSYPEPERQGKFLGLWLTFKIAGQIVGGAIDLGVTANRNEAGSVSYTCTSSSSPLLFRRPKYLLLIPLIANYIYTESVMFTYISLWFTVRSRALGSFVSGLAAAVAGNLMGRLLDNDRWSHRFRARTSFFITITLQGALLAWNVANSWFYIRSSPHYDWSDSGFGNGFAVFVLQVANFQICYMALFWYCGELAETPEEVVRIAGLLRATESASQAVSYGLSSIPSFAHIGGAALNLGIWGVAVVPGWLIVRQIGPKYGKHLRERHENPSNEKLAEIEPQLLVVGGEPRG
ncbi:MFS general substrate transporter [Schizophyllum commune Tattone D]|nr:MFS general substrate transporter [Schizophyllum commune Tattone D]